MNAPGWCDCQPGLFFHPVHYFFICAWQRDRTLSTMLTPDWHCISEPKDLFEMVRTEETAALDAEVSVKRIWLVATDGATNYMRELIDAMDDETFSRWMNDHVTICERQDLIGASQHTLDILQKKPD